MINASVSTINFEWEKLSTDFILEVEPPFGELGSHQEADFEVTVCGSCPGKIDHTLLCHVQHLSEPLTLHIEAEIKVIFLCIRFFLVAISFICPFSEAVLFI